MSNAGQRRYRFTVRADDNDLGGLFDMMRYDRARLIKWDKVASTTPRSPVWVLNLETPAYPSMDRWSSFLILVSDIQEVV